MEESNRYLIVGGSAAGISAAHSIRMHDRIGKITVLSEEADQPYFRPMIPFLVSGKKRAEDIFMHGRGPYTQKGITIKSGCRVVKVDPSKQVVTLMDKQELSYEKILFATGSRPYIPKELSKVKAEGLFALRTLSDARNMSRQVEKTEHAVMLGGGLLNLKAAFALLEKGVKVTLVVRSPEVLSQLMEPKDALLIRRALDRAGLEIKTGYSVKEVVEEKGSIKGVVLDNAKEISCQMVCIGKGVTPNVDFLEGSGIKIDNGIAADRFTACNLPNTFAAGDVAVTYDPVSSERIVTALWTNAVEMGRCAGKNMAGVKTAYSGTFGILNATQVADEPFVSMGQVHTDKGGFEVHFSSSDKYYRKIVFDKTGGRLIGAVFVGDISNAGMYRYVIREKMDINSIKNHIINHSLHYGHLLNNRQK